MHFYTKEDVSRFGQTNFRYIRTHISGHIFTITLARPEKRNAFNPAMSSEIAYALAFANYETDIRCIIFKAEGPVFCAGADLSSFHDLQPENTHLPEPQREIRLGDVFAEITKPIIAQVEGPVLAGGFLIICGCTIVIATPESVFGLPEVKRGIWPMQVMASLEHIISNRKMLEMAITGRNYSSSEMLETGLISRIVDRSHIEAEVNSLALLICENAPLAIQAGIRASREMPGIRASDRHAFLKAHLDKLLQSEDAREGVLAFKEKRKPNWKGQ